MLVVCSTTVSNNLKVDITLDAHVGSVDVGSVNGHVDIGGPVGITPFNVQAIVGLEGGRQGAVVRKRALPFDRHVAVAADGRGDAVVGINLLRDGDFLVVGGSSELDVGLVVVVVDLNIAIVVIEIETRSDSDAAAIGVESLGGFDGANVEVSSSTGHHADTEVGFLVVGIDLEIGAAEVLSIDIGTGADAPSSNVSASLAPDATREGSKVGRRACRGRDAVGEIDIARPGGTLPGDSGVESIDTVKLSVADRDLQMTTKKQTQ
jgi:hypothetical protein